jgi:hypothetical protein
MDSVLQWLKWAVENGPQVISAFVGVLTAMIALFLLIPGDQPEKFLQGVVDFLAKFSIKKSDPGVQVKK